MNNLSYSKSLKHCGNSTDLEKQTATPFVPSVSISTQLKDCRVVLEDISFSCGAVKLQMLDLSQDKTHTTDSHHTTESDFLKNLCLKTPVAWGNAVHERWTQLDDKVSVKLHMCATLAETLTLLQESIYNDAANIFGHLQPKKRNLAGQSRRTKLSIELIQQKNLLLAQINSAASPEQKAALINCFLTLGPKFGLFARQKKLANIVGSLKGPKINSRKTLRKQGKTFLIPSATAA